LLIGWATALAALVVSTAALALVVWFVRFSLAELLIGAALAERGAQADFEVVALDLNGAVISGVRMGAETAPDVAIASVETAWSWNGLAPRLTAVRVVEPRLRLRLDPQGRVSAGALDHLQGRPSARRANIPKIRLDILDGAALIDTPFGALTANIAAEGVIGDDFSAVARIADTTRPGERYALENGRAELIVASRNDVIAFRFNAETNALRWNEARIGQSTLRVMGRAPLDLSRYEAESAWRVAQVSTPRVEMTLLSGGAGLEAIARADGLEPETWQAQARVSAASAAYADNRLANPHLDAHAEGRDRRGQGGWTLAARNFDGLALMSQQPAAAGSFTLDLTNSVRLNADAQLTLARARMDDRAQVRIRNAFPDIPQAPVGPTFAQAERALDLAADRFDVNIPLSLIVDETGSHVMITADAEARAASGATLRLAPLRQDTPAMRLNTDTLALGGAISVELSGGGAPTASLLVDSLAWAPGQPLDADGTIAIPSWRADGASIGAAEIGATLTIQPNGNGRLDLRGPVRVTGPLGDGEVRDAVADLDLAIAWDDGWRVSQSRGCLPMQLGGLDAAGLSFANGALSICPLDNALIAADARGRLSGGFSVRNLGLNGRMAGPSGQPARIASTQLTGRFGGRTGDTILALEAQAPTLIVQMAEDRDLRLAMQRLTANARIANSWSIAGAFTSGVMTDPSLPGSVSAIEGRWTAAPEDNKPVIRVVAGEALLTANRSSEDERELFEPIRLVDVDAIMRDGAIRADGALVLEESSHRLARFAAQHVIEDGAGAAQIRADDLLFDETFQPEHITELALGMVANVRGPARASADISWRREQIGGTGSLRLDGVSLATSTLPVIQDVRGEIRFDDLFALTTPPGQTLTIGMLNPGVVVRDGRVQFQLLPEQRVSVERAEFGFASGVLAMSPTIVALGADETQFELTLRDVDAARLISDLNIPDLSATGRVEGSFPLLLTRRTAYIQNGVLRAQPGGGLISYTGNAGQGATGAARLAFDALRSFRYDSLVLTLDGDLSGDVVSSIAFSGENEGRPVDLGPIAPIPGVSNVTVRGVPFRFNVTVTAPFRRLAETAASITDPGSLLDRQREQPQEPVDRAPPGS